MKHIYKAILAFMVLSATLQLHSQCTGFYDGFESGSYTPTWQMGPGTYTTTVPNTGSAVGTYNLQNASTATNSFYQGVYTTFTPQQPTYCSWWMKTNTTSAANGYVVIGNSNIASDNGIIFCYFNATSQLRFFNTTGYNHPITANTWYHVEARNMNWTTRTCDIYIDNVLILSAWAFRSTTATNIDRIHCFSLSASTPNYDEFVIGAAPVTATAVSTNILCAGDNNGSASVTASGGNGVYSYAWAPSGGTGSSATGLTAGTYTCTITDGVGCTAMQTVSITSPSAIAITATPSDVLCNGGYSGSINASVTGGTGAYTYLWSNAAMTEDISGVGAGTYTLYVVDANNCVDSLTGITVNQPSALTTSSVNTNPACNGDATGSSTVTANGGTAGYTYAWLPGGETTSTVSGMSAGTYSCTVTDANGCTTMETMTITDPAAILVLINAPDTICEGNSAVLMASGSGGTGSLSYVWQPGNLSGSTVTVSPSSTAMQYVVITDSLGCTHTDSTLLTVRMSPSVMLGSDIQQCGGTVVLDAQNAGMLYLWNDNSTSQTLNVAVSGTYFVSVSDSFGCAGSDTINVTLNANPTLYLGADTTQCGGAVVLDAQIAGGTYMWSDSSTSQTLSATLSGVYWVNVVDTNGCSTADTIVVTINAVPTVTASANTLTACALDADIILTGSPSNGTWSGTSVSGNLFDPSVGAGSYSPIYTYTDANGCTGTAGVTIVVSECTGISENSSAALMTLYPNPNSGQFNIVFAADASDVIVEITDVEGRIVQTQQLNSVVAGVNNTISMESTANGFYFVKVIANGSSTTQRISVVR